MGGYAEAVGFGYAGLVVKIVGLCTLTAWMFCFVYTPIRKRSKSFDTICSFMPSSSAVSQLAETYLPLNQSRRSFVNQVKKPPQRPISSVKAAQSGQHSLVHIPQPTKLRAARAAIEVCND